MIRVKSQRHQFGTYTQVDAGGYLTCALTDNEGLLCWGLYDVEEYPDRDNDGYDVLVDCDDDNGTVYPNAVELCDDLDNDCDSSIDEDTSTYFIDVDGDGVGVT